MLIEVAKKGEGIVYPCRLDQKGRTDFVIRCGACLRGKVNLRLGSRCKVCSAKVVTIIEGNYSYHAD